MDCDLWWQKNWLQSGGVFMINHQPSVQMLFGAQRFVDQPVWNVMSTCNREKNTSQYHKTLNYSIITFPLFPLKHKPQFQLTI